MAAWRLFGDIQRLLSSAMGPESGGGKDSSSKQGKQSQSPWPRGMAPVCGIGLAAGLTLAPLVFHNERKRLAAFDGALGSPVHQLASLPFASLSTATVPAVTAPPPDADSAVESSTGLAFPRTLNARKPCCKGPDKFLELSGLGLRSKRLLGLANIKVYAFGVYVDPQELRTQLGDKYKGLSVEALKGSKWLVEDLLSSDVPVIVRLVISYKGLKIGQVRSAFTDSLGGSLNTLSGKPEPDLLQSFTKGFTDDVELHRGTVIDLKRTKGHLVTTEFDGKTAGSVKSSLLSRALLTLYLGTKPFDEKAREAVKETCATILTST